MGDGGALLRSVCFLCAFEGDTWYFFLEKIETGISFVCEAIEMLVWGFFLINASLRSCGLYVALV